MKPIISIILVSLILSSCCKPRFLGELKFSRDELSVNPYSGNEELRFIDDSANVIMFHYGNRLIIQEEYRENETVECSDYYLVEDTDKTRFLDYQSETEINIIIRNQTDPFNGPRIPPVLGFSYVDKSADPDLIINFKGLPVDSIDNSVVKNDFFRDTMTLRTRTFHDIFIMPGSRPSPVYEDGDTLYFTRAEGVVALKFRNGKLYTKQY